MTDRARQARILVMCTYFEPGFRGGGPIRSIAQIIDTVGSGTELTLVTGDRDAGSGSPYSGLSGRWIRRGSARVFYLDPHNVRHWRRLLAALARTDIDILYLNSLWQPVFAMLPAVAARLALLRTRKVIVAPRGQLSPGALSFKPRQKALALWGWRRVLNGLDVVWHASSADEQAQIEKVFPDSKTIVNNNQMSLPRQACVGAPPSDGAIRFVFLSRIAPMKNLLSVLAALRETSQRAELDIYGPISDPLYWQQCLDAVADLPPNVVARYRGELEHSDVRATFARYDAFVFPTLGENFGHVIAESLSASCPVICSGNTPWSAVLQSGGGAVVEDMATSALARELRSWMDMSVDQRTAARRAAGAAYVQWRERVPEVNVLDMMSDRLAGSR